MKPKLKRILAIAVIILLVSLYGMTLVFAFIDSPNAGTLLKGSLIATVVIPVTLYAYLLIYRINKK